MTPLEDVVAKLSEAQRVYLHAVGASPEPYEPRHGVTANWALRHKLTDTIVRLGDREGPWEDFSVQERCGCDVVFLGQRLTHRGLAARDLLNKDKDNV